MLSLFSLLCPILLSPMVWNHEQKKWVTSAIFGARRRFARRSFSIVGSVRRSLTSLRSYLLLFCTFRVVVKHLKLVSSKFLLSTFVSFFLQVHFSSCILQHGAIVVSRRCWGSFLGSVRQTTMQFPRRLWVEKRKRERESKSKNILYDNFADCANI